MREPVKDIIRLQHILDASNKLVENKGKYTQKEMESDPIVFYGFVKLVEIIGEATYMLTKDFRAKHTEVDWRAIEQMRHVLVHGYYTIKTEVLWNTIQEDVEPLIPFIKKYISELEA